MPEYVSTGTAARTLGRTREWILAQLRAGVLDGYCDTTNAGARTKQYFVSCKSIEAYLEKRKVK